jgi:hypothetical protein
VLGAANILKGESGSIAQKSAVFWHMGRIRIINLKRNACLAEVILLKGKRSIVLMPVALGHIQGGKV